MSRPLGYLTMNPKKKGDSKVFTCPVRPVASAKMNLGSDEGTPGTASCSAVKSHRAIAGFEVCSKGNEAYFWMVSSELPYCLAHWVVEDLDVTVPAIVPGVCLFPSTCPCRPPSGRPLDRREGPPAPCHSFARPPALGPGCRSTPLGPRSPADDDDDVSAMGHGIRSGLGHGRILRVLWDPQSSLGSSEFLQEGFNHDSKDTPLPNQTSFQAPGRLGKGLGKFIWTKSTIWTWSTCSLAPEPRSSRTS